MDNVQFDEAPVIPQSDKHKKPKVIKGFTGFLVKKGLSKKQANLILLGIVVVAIVLAFLIRSESPEEAAESNNRIPFQDRPESVTR